MLERFVEANVFPGAVAAASRRGVSVLRCASGSHTYEPDAPPVQQDTLYDLASVTKVFTAVAVLTLIDQGQINLADSAQKYLPALAGDCGNITVGQLLTHTSGLPSVPELHVQHESVKDLEAAMFSVSLEYNPGEAVLYTSLGYQYLGYIIEAVSGLRLDEYIQQSILSPCGLDTVHFTPSASERSRIAPTEYSARRGRLLQGEVHDENSATLGGITGHTGLFAQVQGVLAFGEVLLTNEPEILKEESRRLLFSDLTSPLFPRRSAAFVIDDPLFGTWPSTTFSHTGFTGTSLCLVPDYDLVVVLLSNRVHPSRSNTRIANARTEFHEALIELIENKEGAI